jgi:hypothetical protein
MQTPSAERTDETESTVTPPRKVEEMLWEEIENTIYPGCVDDCRQLVGQVAKAIQEGQSSKVLQEARKIWLDPMEDGKHNMFFERLICGAKRLSNGTAAEPSGNGNEKNLA